MAPTTFGTLENLKGSKTILWETQGRFQVSLCPAPSIAADGCDMFVIKLSLIKSIFRCYSIQRQTCHSVIGCRLSPDQKRALVALVRENVAGTRTLSIGKLTFALRTSPLSFSLSLLFYAFYDRIQVRQMFHQDCLNREHRHSLGDHSQTSPHRS